MMNTDGMYRYGSLMKGNGIGLAGSAGFIYFSFRGVLGASFCLFRIDIPAI